MILVFLGSMRATVAVFFSIPLSALAAFIALDARRQLHQHHGAGRPGAGVLAPDRQLGGGAGEHLSATWNWARPPEVAAEKGGREVALPVLAATLTTAVVFFPVTFLYGVSKFLFTALALAVVLSLFASYRGGHDGGAAVLRPLHSQPAHGDELGTTAAQVGLRPLRALVSTGASTRC